MGTLSERTNNMMKNFMSWHEDGLSIPEIAKKCNLHSSTVYAHLQEIADEYGVTRDDLLQVVYSPRSETACKVQIDRTKENFAKLHEDFDQAASLIENAICIIDDILKEEY